MSSRYFSNATYRIGLADAHLIGKIVDEADDVVLRAWKFTPEERVRAQWIFENLDRFLDDQIGDEWNNEPVA